MHGMLRGLGVMGVLAVGALSVSPVHAEKAASDELAPQHRLYYSNLTAARYNPLGGADAFRLEYRWRLWDNPGVLFKDAWIMVGLTPIVTPALALLGGTIEVKPLTILSLQASLYRKQWFGSFGYLQSFAVPGADYSDTALDAGEDADLNYVTGGTEVQLRATVLGKVGPVVVRNDAKFYWSNVKLRGGDALYYAITIDHLLENGGWAYTDDLDVLYLSGGPWVLGVRATFTDSLYRDTVFPAGGSTDDPNGPTIRVGPLFAWTFDDVSPTFTKPTVLVVANFWAKHRFRTGADSSAAIPYLVVGFKFEGEFWRSN